MEKVGITAAKTGFKGEKELGKKLANAGILTAKNTVKNLETLWKGGSIDDYEETLKSIIGDAKKAVENIDREAEKAVDDSEKLKRTETKEKKVKKEVEKDLKEMEEEDDDDE